MTKKILIDFETLKSKVFDMIINMESHIDENNGYSDRKLKAWFEAEPAAPQWVAVAYDTPDYGKEVFVRTDSGHIFNARLRYEGCWWDIAKDDAVVLDVITHWMEIPELPEKNE